MSWVDARGSARQTALGATLTASTTEDWLATARARIGVTPVDHWLVYATGGLAVADVEASILPATGSSSTEALGSESHVRPGWTAGGGLEASIIGNWSVKLEYLYVGLQNHGYFVPTPAGRQSRRWRTAKRQHRSRRHKLQVRLAVGYQVTSPASHRTRLDGERRP